MISMITITSKARLITYSIITPPFYQGVETTAAVPLQLLLYHIFTTMYIVIMYKYYVRSLYNITY